LKYHGRFALTNETLGLLGVTYGGLPNEPKGDV